MEQAIIKNVGKWGNSAGILLPKEWLGNQVKIVLIDRTLEIKKEVLSILDPYLEDIIGIYLTGSYARGEQEEDSDIDVIAISKSTKKEIISGKYDISITTLEGIKKTLGSHPELVIPRLREAKTILNPQLLEELNEHNITKNSFKNFVEDTKRMIKMDKELIELDKLDGEELESKPVIYSIILRLRGIFLIKSALENKKYSKSIFKIWVLETLNEKEFKDAYAIYKSIKNKKESKIKMKLETAKKLQEFLIKELKYFKK
ncbi:MAG: DUF2080 family transposase-associated protein [archaeon]|nr:DUF2080 family transposase-associated protein [archaeon]